jgi:hypothetical protein
MSRKYAVKVIFAQVTNPLTAARQYPDRDCVSEVDR